MFHLEHASPRLTEEVHVLNIIPRGRLCEMYKLVLPSSLLEGMRDQPVGAQIICCTVLEIDLQGCHPRRKSLLKMTQSDMDYWSPVLWSDETKIRLFGPDDVKHSMCKEYRDKCALPYIQA